MCFYLEGRTIPDGAFFKLEEEFWTIEAALEAAKMTMAPGTAVVWIMDHQKRLILSFQEVKDRLWPPKAVGP